MSDRVCAAWPVVFREKDSKIETLLVRPRGQEALQFCWGKVEWDETLQETVIRESIEEVWAIIKLTNDWFAIQTDNMELSHVLAYIDNIYDLIPWAEIESIQWVAVEGIQKENVQKNVPLAVNHYLEKYKWSLGSLFSKAVI